MNTMKNTIMLKKFQGAKNDWGFYSVQSQTKIEDIKNFVFKCFNEDPRKTNVKISSDKCTPLKHFTTKDGKLNFKLLRKNSRKFPCSLICTFNPIDTATQGKITN